MFRQVLGALIIAGFGAAASAQAARSKAAPAATGTDPIVVTGELPDAKERVCKKSVATGSIMPKRECRSRAEWEEIRQRSIAQVERHKKEREAELHVNDVRDGD